MKKISKKIYISLAVFLAVVAVAGACIGFLKSQFFTDWLMKREAVKNYETLLESVSDVKDETTLRQLLLLDETLEITVNKDIEVRKGFTVNGDKTLKGSSAVKASMGAYKVFTLFMVSEDASLTMDGLVVDGNGIANGIEVKEKGELTYHSGEITYAGRYGIITNGLTTLHDFAITQPAVGAIDAAYGSKVYIKGGRIEDSRSYGISVEANAYMEITGNPVISGTMHNAIRNRGELYVYGGTFENIGYYVIANYGKLRVENRNPDSDYIEMKTVKTGAFYNKDTEDAIVKDIHAVDMSLDAVKMAGGAAEIENCYFDTTVGHGVYMSGGTLTVKDTTFDHVGKCGAYVLSKCVLNLESVTVNDPGTQGVMLRGGTVNGENVTIRNAGTIGVSNQKSPSLGTTGTAEYTNLKISGSNKHNVYNTSAGTKTIIHGGEFTDSGRTNVYISNGELVMNDVVIHGTKAVTDCESIRVTSQGVCTLGGKSTVHGQGIRGVTINGTGVFNLKGGEIYGYSCEKASGGAVRVNKGTRFNMSGGSLYNNKTGLDGGAVFVNNGGTFHMTGGKIYNNAAKNSGGAVYVQINGQFDLSGGTIEENTAQTYSGGAVYVVGKMNMSGGSLTENRSTTVGGAINVNTRTDSKTKEKVCGELVMTGGKIQGNYSKGNGGGINISSNTTVTMTGGSIADNVSAQRGNGVNQNGTFIVGRNAYLKNNAVALGGTSKYVTIQGTVLGAHSAKDPFPIEPSYGAAKGTVLARCESAGAAAGLLGSLSSGSKAYTSFGQSAETIVINGYKEAADMNMAGADTVYVSNYQQLKEAVESTASKRYVVLCDNIAMEGVITVPDGNTVCIKDDGTRRVLSRANANVGSFFRTTYGTGLAITGSQKGNVVLDGTTYGVTDTSKVSQFLVVRGTTEISNVTMKENPASGYNGAFIRQYYGTMNVSDCTLSGAKGSAGGAISVEVGTANINRTVFDGNSTKYSAGAIRVVNRATVTVASCEFRGNTADSVGGAINCDAATLVVKDSVFEENSSKGTSGAINLTNVSTATITDSVFKGNQSTADNGGAMKVNKSALSLVNTTFENNHTTNSGGALFLQDKINADTYAYVTATGCTFKSNSADKTGGAIKGETGTVVTLEDTDFIQNQSAGTTGGAIDLYRATVNADNCSFEGNAAKAAAGAIYLNSKGAAANLTGCQFQGNSTTTYGGAIYVQKDAFAVLTGNTLCQNQAGIEGGAVYSKGTVTGKNNTVEKNTSNGSGGAIYVDESASVEVSDMAFLNNETKNQAGGAVYVKGQFSIDGNSSFTENKSKTSGGAIWITGESASVNISDTTFTKNQSGNYGGAIDVNGGSNGTGIVLAGCTFDSNQAKADGNGHAISIREKYSATIAGAIFIGTEKNREIAFAGASNMGQAIISGAIIGAVVKYSQPNKAGLVIGKAGIAGSDITVTPKAYIEGDALLAKTEETSDEALKEAAKVIKLTENADNKEWSIKEDGTLHAVEIQVTYVARNEATQMQYTSLAEAVKEAKDGETIVVLCDMKLGETISIADRKNLTITNESGKDITLVRGISSSLFDIKAGGTLTLGSKEAAGTLVMDGGYNVDAQDLITAPALVKNAGTLNIEANVTIQNAATGSAKDNASNNGGALYNTGTANLSGSFTGNSGYNGGAIYNAGGTLNITGGIYSNNLGAYRGGAVFVAKNTEHASIANAEMTKNDITHKNSQGVAIYLEGGNVSNELNLEGCNIHGNTVEYATDTECGSDILLGDHTTLNLKENINVGVLHQRYGYAAPTNSGSSWPYAKINVMENYTGKITIIPNAGNFTNAALGVGKAQIVSFDAQMSEEEKEASASKIVIRRVASKVNDDDTYCVDALGILQNTVAKVGSLRFLTLEKAFAAVTAEEETTVYLLRNAKFSGTLAVGSADMKRNIILEGKAGVDVTLTRAEADSMIYVAKESTFTISINLDGNKEVKAPHFIKNEGSFVLETGATVQNAFTESDNASNSETYNGGALYNTGTATLKGSFIGCSAFNGGAVYNAANASMEVSGAVFKENVTCGGNGGAIRNLGTLTVKDSLFENNKAVSNNGGAVYTNTADFEVVNTTFKGNTASKSGGAIYADTASTKCTITNCDFVSNTASGGTGGAVRATNILTITEGKFTGNKATTGGGAIDVSGTGVISNVKMYDNSLTAKSGNTFYGGGAIYIGKDKKLALNNSNIYNNNSSYDSKVPSCDISNNGTLTLAGIIADDGDDTKTEQCLVYQSKTLYYVSADGVTLVRR